MKNTYGAHTSNVTVWGEEGGLIRMLQEGKTFAQTVKSQNNKGIAVGQIANFSRMTFTLESRHGRNKNSLRLFT